MEQRVSDETFGAWCDGARREGTQDAIAAASWISTENDEDGVRRILSLLADGDPRADEYLPMRPNLSGEWADDPTPLSLARYVTGEDDPGDDVIDRLADEYEDAVMEAWEPAITAELRRQLPD